MRGGVRVRMEMWRVGGMGGGVTAHAAEVTGFCARELSWIERQDWQ